MEPLLLHQYVNLVGAIVMGIAAYRAGLKGCALACLLTLFFTVPAIFYLS
ncbi:hypothetical protein VP275E431_P0067 [Vibrio phage 275E43-1]|nr:hypothetical protein VP275E431_P0067 [Vibrio phage 275E43-1]